MEEEIKSWFRINEIESNPQIKTMKIESLEELDRYLLAIKDDYIYRGISKEEHLYPTIIRAFAKKNNICTNKVENHNDVSTLERDLLKDLINNGSAYIKDFSALGLLATAQHFGLPTRCVDWTYNIYVALYFALNNDLYTRKEICIMTCSISENLFWDDIPFLVENIDDLKVVDLSPDKNIGKRFESYRKVFQSKDKFEKYRLEYINKMYAAKSCNQVKDSRHIQLSTQRDIKKIKNGNLLFLNPNFNNERISTQQGVFQVPTKLDAKLIRSQIRKNVTFIIFNLESIGASNLVKRMKQVGINGYKIMPDLENVCKNIYKKRIDGKYIG